MKIFILLILIMNQLISKEIKIATYNVENLFDLYKDGYEYKEYIPYKNNRWNRKNYLIKLKNISRVIKDIDADIIALEEIESLKALKDLRTQLKNIGLYYKYYKIANLKNTTVKVAVLSKFPFLYTKELYVTQHFKYRNILEIKINLNNNDLYIFINHWKSKRGPESNRIVSAKVLKKRIKELGYDKNIIALGDFNSDYEEYKILKQNKRNNDTNGKTGINHILGTKYYIHKSNIVKLKNGDLYNLWYDINKKYRYTHIFRNHKEALDSILVSKSLLNKKNTGIRYKLGSIYSLQRTYLMKNKKLYRWQMSKKKPRYHLGKGYSDHLPISAIFIY